MDLSKLNSFFRDDQYIVCAINRDELAHELFSASLKPCFINSLQGIGITSMLLLYWSTNQKEIFGGLETVQAQLWTLQ